MTINPLFCRVVWFRGFFARAHVLACVHSHKYTSLLNPLNHTTNNNRYLEIGFVGKVGGFVADGRLWPDRLKNIHARGQSRRRTGGSMSKHHDTPAWLRAIQRDGGPVREWHHEQGDSAPFQGRAVPLREVGSARAPRAAGDPAEPSETACPDPIVASVCALLLSRSAVGVAKYGVTLARDDLSRKQWLVHARDEALDMALYLQRLIEMENGE